MMERPEDRVSAARRKPRQIDRAGPRSDAGEALIALARAWTVTMIATALLFAALAMAPLWDRAIFMQALQQSASNGASLGQSAGETAAW